MIHYRTLILTLFLLFILAACSHADSNSVTIQTNNMAFVPKVVTVKVGEPVALQVINRDGYAHAFDLDAFNIHTPLAAKETATFTFTPQTAGRFSFYCSAPGHQMAGMEGLVIVNP